MSNLLGVIFLVMLDFLCVFNSMHFLVISLSLTHGDTDNKIGLLVEVFTLHVYLIYYFNETSPCLKGHPKKRKNRRTTK